MNTALLTLKNDQVLYSHRTFEVSLSALLRGFYTSLATTMMKSI